MNRGYAAYLKESKTAVKETFKGKGSYIKYYIWVFMLCLGKLFILPNSAMDLSIVKQSKNVLENKRIGVFDSFENTFKARPFWSLLLSRMLYAFFLFACLAVIIFLAASYFSFCSWVVVALNISMPELILLVLTIPVFVFLTCFFISVIFRSAPMAYVAYTDNDAQASSILSKSFKAMNKGKFTLFLNAVRIWWFTSLFTLALILGIVIFEYIVSTFFFTGGCLFGVVFSDIFLELNEAMNIDLLIPIADEVLEIVFGVISIVEVGLLILALFSFLKLDARLTLVSLVASYALFEDLVDDKFNQNKVAVGFFVKTSKTKTIKDMSLKDVFNSSSSVSCAVSSPVVEKRVLKDLSNEISLDDGLNVSFENKAQEVNE